MTQWTSTVCGATYYRLDEVLEEAVYSTLPTSVLVGEQACVHINVTSYQAWIDWSRFRVDQVRLRLVCLLSICLVAGQIRQSVVLQDDRAVDCSVSGASESCSGSGVDPEVWQAGISVEYWRQEISERLRAVETSLHVVLVILVCVRYETGGDEVVGTQQAADQADGCIKSVNLWIGGSIEILRRDVRKLAVNYILQAHDYGCVYAIDDDQAPIT